MGNLALAGETARQKTGFEIIDYNSSYDGLYTTNTTSGPDTTFWFSGHDSIKGTITTGTPPLIAGEEKARNQPEFRLGKAYPNPFNPSTAIDFSLPGNARVTLEVYNLSGQKVATLLDEWKTAGTHTITWNAGGLPSGT